MRKTSLSAIVFVALLFAVRVFASDLGEVAFRQALKDSGHTLRLMCVAAHPDDEDGATLAYYRMKYGVTTYAVIATRGEGGQNEIGPELYEALGVIRTREMQAAAAVEGAQLRFLNLPEFGYSKSAEETFAQWGYETALERMVRLIREIQPHVIITNHGRLQDHGHHQAIGKVVVDAFDAAGDPARFPGHLDAGLKPWRVGRLYSRAYGDLPGEGRERLPWQRGPESVAVPISELHPERGLTYAQVAAEALALHRSQGMKEFIDRYLTGWPVVYYDKIRETPLSGEDLPHVLDDSCGALFSGIAHARNMERFGLSRSALPREELKPRLLALATESRRYRQQGQEQMRGWERVNRAAAVAAQLRLEAVVDDATLVHGQKAVVKAVFNDYGEADATSVLIRLEFRVPFPVEGAARFQERLEGTPHVATQFHLTVPAAAPITLPHEAHLFDPDFLEPQVRVIAEVQCGGATVELEAPVYVDIAPPLGVAFVDAPYLYLAGGEGPAEIALRLTNHAPGAQEHPLAITPPPGWGLAPVAPVVFGAEDEQRMLRVALQPPAGVGPGEQVIGVFTPGLAQPLEARLRVVDVVVPGGRRVGLIGSYDDTLSRTLDRLGVPHAAIGDADFSEDRLQQFSTVLVDMRAYRYRPDLVANNAALLAYVRGGGRLVVNYQKTLEWRSEYAPYPLRVSNNRVTREDAPVEVLVPEHPLFQVPNRIGAEDWGGWIQERGLYFPDKWDDAYTPLLACSDPGEVIPPGALLVADYGAGKYVYTALVWYRQLRELHPGALRMFANLLAL
jgi:LmbE family N-acetylglucosaminyl deacetylase